jgi:hypothetical protein
MKRKCEESFTLPELIFRVRGFLMEKNVTPQGLAVECQDIVDRFMCQDIVDQELLQYSF